MTYKILEIYKYDSRCRSFDQALITLLRLFGYSELVEKEQDKDKNDSI